MGNSIEDFLAFATVEDNIDRLHAVSAFDYYQDKLK